VVSFVFVRKWALTAKDWPFEMPSVTAPSKILNHVILNLKSLGQ
jgi:hypothetical protein